MYRLFLVAATVLLVGAAAQQPCQCDAGTYWCTTTDDLRYQFNCSGTEEARALYNHISTEQPTPATCQALHRVCDSSDGAHGAPMANTTCDDSCYSFCWKRDVGDCADMDDCQTFCVGECMDYCTNTRCATHPKKWSSCQQQCNTRHMEAQEGPNFVDYSLCMSKCTPVPTTPWGVTPLDDTPLTMSVTTTNLVGCTVNLRSVDPTTGKYGPAFCTMSNGSSCTATQDFIAVVADGTGRYDAGDPFDAWWGDESWKTAVIGLELRQGSNPQYLEYVKKQQSLAEASTPKLNCSSIVAPKDPESKLPMFTVRQQSDGDCVVECDPRVHNTTVLACMDFSDGVNSVFEKANMTAGCVKNQIDAPDEAPGTEDPEMFTFSCPEWFMYVGWDRGVSRTLGNMRQELLLKSGTAVEVISKAFRE